MKRFSLVTLTACVSFVVAVDAEELRLKTRTIDPQMESLTAFQLRSAALQPRSMSGRRWHWLVQFESSEPEFSIWLERGAKVLSSVPVNGFVISTPDEMSWEGLSFTYRAPLLASDKISPETRMAEASKETAEARETPQLVIVHFHKDVEVWQSQAILEAESVVPIPHGSLEAQDILAELTVSRMQALSLWDEVEYIFPAPEGMRLGELYLGCGGVLSGGYEIAMLAASFGEGWDGPGRGRASISYSFGNLGSRINPDLTRAEVRRAFNEWSRVVAVTFAESTSRNSNRNLDILFATGSHGDSYPFLPGSSVLAHSFYPANPNPEPIAGDIHINDAWSWSIGGQWDVFSVVLHEIGHSLGIGHTDSPGSVMYPYYQAATGLKQSDIDSIRQLYADPSTTQQDNLSLTIANPPEGSILSTRTVNISGAITAGAQGLSIQATNESNNAVSSCWINSNYTVYTCAAVALAGGANRIRITAANNADTFTALRNLTLEVNQDVSLNITSPSTSPLSTTSSQIQLAGTAGHSSGIAQVSWATNRLKSGRATGLQSWNATVPLETGLNQITVTAMAQTGLVTNKKLTIERTPPPTPGSPASPGEDKVPPRMTLQQPIGNFIITSAQRLTFRGTATDNVAVTQVTWTNSAGDQSGAAMAKTVGNTVNWSFDVNIAVGFNAIQVRAWDAAGNSTLYSTTVRRY